MLRLEVVTTDCGAWAAAGSASPRAKASATLGNRLNTGFLLERRYVADGARQSRWELVV